MKLLLISRRFPPDVVSGTETWFENLYRQARVEHEVRLIVGYHRDRKHIPAEALGIDLRGSSPRLDRLTMWRAFQTEKRQFVPDAILTTTLATVSDIPTVYLAHDSDRIPGDPPLEDRISRAWRWMAVRRLARIIVSSKVAYDRWRMQGAQPHQLVTIRPGVDPEQFKPIDRTLFLGSETDKISLLYAGRIFPAKGQHLAIDAICRLTAAEKSRIHLRIAGAVADPVYLEQLKTQAYRQPVSFHLQVPTLVPYYQQADLILFPTLQAEEFGYTAIEGMACGVPVVWTDRPELRELTGGIGFSVPPDDPSALRDRIRQFLDDPTSFRDAGLLGREYVLSCHTWPRVWSEVEQILEAL